MTRKAEGSGPKRRGRRAGITGVKVDCQAGVGLIGSRLGGGPAVAARYHAALEASIATHFPHNAMINCMCHSTENLYRCGRRLPRGCVAAAPPGLGAPQPSARALQPRLQSKQAIQPCLQSFPHIGKRRCRLCWGGNVLTCEPRLGCVVI